MNDPIDREAAKEHFHKRLIETALNNIETSDIYEDIADNRIDVWFDELPSAQPDLSGYSSRLWKAAYERGKAEAQRTGKWVEYDNSHCECPLCHAEWSYFDNDVERFNYCPNCGAKMEEPEDIPMEYFESGGR